MRTVTLTLTAKEFDELVDLLHEKAIEMNDDGREGNPGAALLYRVARIITRERRDQ